MKINAALILEERLRRAWSQDELSVVTGLSIRTIQRMEKEGLASLQSKKALAAVFEIEAADLDYEEIFEMKRYEYKTVEMPFKFGIFKQNPAECRRGSGLASAPDPHARLIQFWPE